MQTLVAYVPVLHEGYHRFFTKNEGEKELYIFGSEIIKEFSWLAKEIRQLDPELMKKVIESLGIFESVTILTVANVKKLNDSSGQLILPNEDISRSIAEKYFINANVEFDTIFLRWDKHNSIAEKPIVSAEKITSEEFHRNVLQQAHNEAEKSSDNWRHVGGIIVKDGKILLSAHNTHVPSEHMPYVNGDPRSNFHKGNNIEISTAIHAEAYLIAQAAHEGISLEGADMYVTVFPCPPCAKLIAYSGIKNLYCGGGYAVLDGESILVAKGVKIFFVE
jgi:dCMP deaminase